VGQRGTAWDGFETGDWVRVQLAVVALIGGLSLSACTSSTHHPSASTTSSGTASASSPTSSPSVTGIVGLGSTANLSAYCRRLIAAGTRLNEAQTSLFRPGGTSSAAITTITTELAALQSGAPASIKSTLVQLGTDFQHAEPMLAHQTAQNAATLAALGARISAEGAKIGAYVTSACKAK
jgi:hypothetical protein